MQAFQERVVVEQKELQAKLTALEVFIGTETYRSLTAEERDRLSRQRDYMDGYNRVLRERIAAFE